MLWVNTRMYLVNMALSDIVMSTISPITPYTAFTGQSISGEQYLYVCRCWVKIFQCCEPSVTIKPSLPFLPLFPPLPLRHLLAYPAFSSFHALCSLNPLRIYSA